MKTLNRKSLLNQLGELQNIYYANEPDIWFDGEEYKSWSDSEILDEIAFFNSMVTRGDRFNLSRTLQAIANAWSLPTI